MPGDRHPMETSRYFVRIWELRARHSAQRRAARDHRPEVPPPDAPPAPFGRRHSQAPPPPMWWTGQPAGSPAGRRL